MRYDLLDYEEGLKPQRTFFSKASFIIAILNISLFVYVISLIPARITAKNGMTLPSHWGIIVAMLCISCLLGFVISIIALARKENMTFYKVIGCVINFIVIALLIASIVFANTI